MKDMAEIWSWRRKLQIAQKRFAGMPEAQAEASIPKVTLDVVDISFDAIADPKERIDLMNLPTTFVLPAEDINRLREAASRLMRQSVEFQSIVRKMGGNAAY